MTTIGISVRPEQCAWNQQWAATAANVESGKYYEPVGVQEVPTREGSNDELAERLWEWTAKELEGYGL